MALEPKHAAIISLGSYRAGRTCSFCDSRVATSDVCSSCGRDTTSTRRWCRKCAKVIPSNERVCWNCAARVPGNLRWSIPLAIFLFLVSLTVAGYALK